VQSRADQRGDVKKTQCSNAVMAVKLSEVLWIPELEYLLVSVHKLVSGGEIVE
jgi:hypothetical protein